MLKCVALLRVTGVVFYLVITLFLSYSNAEVKAKENKNITLFYMLLVISDVFFSQTKVNRLQLFELV